MKERMFWMVVAVFLLITGLNLMIGARIHDTTIPGLVGAALTTAGVMGVSEWRR